MKPILFLLKPDFTDVNIQESQKFYCPSCATIEGILSYYPHVKEQLDIRYVTFAKPRTEIIKLIGEENQSCPVLVVSLDNEFANSFTIVGDKKITNEKMQIATFLARQFNIGMWHP
ncbi:MAG: DUF3088 family protein [Chryseotalea sp.]|nr:DUF3088 family protein [Cyclobacteriaceae bacterium]